MIKYVVVMHTKPDCAVYSYWFNTKSEAISFAMTKCDIDESYQVYSCEYIGKAQLPDPEPVFLSGEDFED